MRGSTMKEIWQTVHDSGLILSYSNFVTYYHRLAKTFDASVIDKHHEIPVQREEGQVNAESSIPPVTELSVLEKLDEARKKIGQKDYSKVALDHARNKNKL